MDDPPDEDWEDDPSIASFADNFDQSGHVSDRKNQLRPDVRLNLAITLDECEDVLEMDTSGCPQHEKWSDLIQEHGVTQLIPNIYPDYYYCLEKLVRSVELKDNPSFSEFLEAALPSFTGSLNHMMKGNGNVPTTPRGYWNVLQDKFSTRLKVDQLKDKILTEYKGSPFLLSESPMLLYDSSICLFKCKDHGKGLIPTTCLFRWRSSLRDELE